MEVNSFRNFIVRKECEPLHFASNGLRKLTIPSAEKNLLVWVPRHSITALPHAYTHRIHLKQSYLLTHTIHNMLYSNILSNTHTVHLDMFSSIIHYYVHLTGIVYDTEIFPFENSSHLVWMRSQDKNKPQNKNKFHLNSNGNEKWNDIQ